MSRIGDIVYRARLALMANPVTARLARTAFALKAALIDPPFVPPGHWASPLTSPADVARAVEGRTLEPAGVDLVEAQQLALFGDLTPMLIEPFEGPRYSTGPANTMYRPGDAALYRALLRHLRPKRVLEVGSGYSTAVALDTADAHLPDLDLACVEPFPERLFSTLVPGDADRLGLERAAVQDLPLRRFDALRAGDVLFIDSSHVVKPGSDTRWLLLEVLPRLAPGVIVHVHDIFWPFEYPDDWLRERRDWTEGYLLQALLSGSTDWRVLLFSSWVWECHPELVPAAMAGENPGSIWLQRT